MRTETEHDIQREIDDLTAALTVLDRREATTTDRERLAVIGVQRGYLRDRRADAQKRLDRRRRDEAWRQWQQKQRQGRGR